MNAISEKLTLSNISIKKPFLRDLLLAWSKFANKTVISNYHNEIIWNNSNIRVGENTIFYKEWFQLGIKHVKDIYDQQNQRYYSFYKLQEKFNLPATEFLRYMSRVVSGIPGAIVIVYCRVSFIPFAAILDTLSNDQQPPSWICFFRFDLSISDENK